VACAPAVSFATPNGIRITSCLTYFTDFSYAVGVMARPESLGQFEQLVLTAVLALGENSYGVTIHAKVEQLSRPKRVLLGAVYITLDRLEQKGLLSSRLSDPTPERGGRAKRCYRLDAAGVRALQESAITARRMWDIVSKAWGDRNWSQAWK
jgi:PadR family transcriptional regulator, regulatory protein PadR